MWRQLCYVLTSQPLLTTHNATLPQPSFWGERPAAADVPCRASRRALCLAMRSTQFREAHRYPTNSAVICRTCNNMLSTPKCLGKGSDTKGSTITSKGPTPTITSKGLTISSTVVLAEILRNGRAWLLIIILIWSFLLEALCNCVLNALIFPHQSHPDVF